MYVRLGFSIAAHLQPDILLLDEVLAVGDAEFQVKCYDRIRTLKERGTTIVFISHDLNAVEFLCDRALLLSSGEIAADGFTSDVIRRYQRAACGVADNESSAVSSDGTHKPIRITGLTFSDAQACEVLPVRTGDPLTARVEFAAIEALDDLDFEVFYYSPDGRLHCKFSTSLSTDPLHLNRGAGAIQFSCDELGLQPGLYYADATIKRRTDGIQIDWQYRLALLRVEQGKHLAGSFYNPHRWRIIQPKAALETDRVLCHVPFELKGPGNHKNANTDWREF
jgi:lipopolysaccharide transport system ATP-binding protein